MPGYREGDMRAMEADWKGALRLYRAIKPAGPAEEAELALRRAACFAALGNPRGAEECARLSARLAAACLPAHRTRLLRAWAAAPDLHRPAAAPEPGVAAAYAQAAAERLRAGDAAGAIAALRAAVAIHPEGAEAYRLLGEALAQGGQVAEAAGALGTHAALVPDPAAPRIRQAALLGQAGQWPAAAEALEQAAASRAQPDHGLLLLLAEARGKAGQWWLQVSALEAALELADLPGAAWFELGAARERMGRFAAAADAFAIAVGRDPSNAEAHYRLGRCLERAGEDAAARRAYDAAVALEPAAAPTGEAWFHARAGAWQAAAASLRALVARRPDEGELRFRLGLALDRSLEWAQAATAYGEALALDPGQGEWLFRLGYVLERLKRWTEAADAYGRALAASPAPRPYWRYRLGYVLHAAGRPDDAVAILLEAAPAEAMTAAAGAPPPGTMEALSGRRAGILRDRAADAAAWEALGEDAFRLGAWEVAAEAYGAAIARDGAHVPARHWRRGAALARLGHAAEACRALLETRRLKRAYGIDEAVHLRTQAQRDGAAYAEYLDLLPIEPRTILYESNLGGGIACNPRAIFERLVADPAFADWFHVWAVTEGASVPDALLRHPNVACIRKGSDGYLRHLASAGHLVNNSTFPPGFVRRPGQRYLNTWHGTPLKALGVDMAVRGEFMGHANTARNLLHATHVITPNPHTTGVLLGRNGIASLFAGRIALTGLPRMDRSLRAPPQSRAALRERLGLADGSPVVLHAPTFRGPLGDAGLDGASVEEMLEALSATGAQVLFRGHHYARGAGAPARLPAVIVPDDVDTNDLLAIVDVLVTDYSSIMFDFLALRRPLVLCCPDLEDYVEERGRLYLDPAALPATFCRTPEEAAAAVRRHLRGPYVPDARHEEAIARFSPMDDGGAVDRAIAFFLHDAPAWDVPRPDDGRARLLFYAGPLVTNGITSSFLALAGALEGRGYDIALAVDRDQVGAAAERRARLAELPPGATVIGRVGDMVQSVEERWLNGILQRDFDLPSAAAWDIHAACMRREFRRVFGDARFDARVFFEGYTGLWGSILGNPPGREGRGLAFLHNDMRMEWRNRFPSLERTFRGLGAFDALVSVSPAMLEVNRAGIGAAFGLPDAAFVACPNLVRREVVLRMAEEALDPAIEEWARGSWLFLAVCRLSAEKDPLSLIRAFAALPAAGSEARLLVVGEGPMLPACAHLAARLGLGDAVRFAGHQANPFPAMRRADCLVLSSAYEGCPMVLLEALVLGRRVLATDLPGNRLLLDEGRGLLVPRGVAALAGGMAEAMSRTAAFAPFDWAAYRRDAIARFEEALHGPGGPRGGRAGGEAR